MYRRERYRDGLAFKFPDGLVETVLRRIEWAPSRTGEITPVAVFDTVQIDGCDVSRASLHNLSFIEGLELMPGNRIHVSKRNMIIPHVEENLDCGGFDLEQVIPCQCPCCGAETRIHSSGSAKTLFCDNENCETRRLAQFVHFAGKKAMDIEGLSETTLEKLIGRGWLHNRMDIYRLNEHRDEIINLEGFGEKSWQRLWDAIQRSRDITFERYLTVSSGDRDAPPSHAVWFDIPCPVCGKAKTNSWEKRISRALNYRGIVCEACIAREYDLSIDALRVSMEKHFGLTPCLGL